MTDWTCRGCSYFSAPDRFCKAFDQTVVNVSISTCHAHSARTPETLCAECGEIIGDGDLCWDCAMKGPDPEVAPV